MPGEGGILMPDTLTLSLKRAGIKGEALIDIDVGPFDFVGAA
jgi:hypothetical protein